VLSLKSPNQLYVLLAIAGVIILLLLTAPDKEPELQQAVLPGVRVAVARLHDLVPVETISGRLEPARKAALHFELSGQVQSRPVEPGQAVEQDEILLSLEPGDYEDALSEAEAQLAQESRDIQRDRELLKLSKQNYALQKNDVDRLQQLGADSLVSASRLDAARIKLIQLESDVARLRSSVGSAESRMALRQAASNRAVRNLERTQLSAPFPGIVNAVSVQAGDYITPNQTVVDLIDTVSLDLYVEVRGDVAQALTQGQSVDVDVNGARLTGKVIALQADPDPVTFTHALRVRLAGDRVRSGQVAQAHLQLQPLDGVIAVPVTAVLFDEGRTYVFRLNGDTLEMVEVVPGKRVGELQVVQQGINANDRIVTRDVSSLSHGQLVRAIESAESTVTR
jgi:RND family efflux transporter MFP subunit